LHDVKRKLSEKTTELKKKQRAIADADNTLETRVAIRNMSLGELGRSCGRAKAKANRASVLDRIARCGDGLSAAQKNDWGWFKDAWDTRMLEEHKDEWPATFASWMQKVLDGMEQDSATFSRFVHQETVRCFSDEVALQVPGQG
jgi:hypothetical protein